MEMGRYSSASQPPPGLHLWRHKSTPTAGRQRSSHLRKKVTPLRTAQAENGRYQRAAEMSLIQSVSIYQTPFPARPWISQL